MYSNLFYSFVSLQVRLSKPVARGGILTINVRAQKEDRGAPALKEKAPKEDGGPLSQTKGPKEG